MATVDDFKPGDMVKLKSGGPVMTVDLIGPRVPGSLQGAKKFVHTKWFSGNKLEAGYFDPDSIRITDQSPTLPAE